LSAVGDYLESVFSLDGKVVLLTGACGGIGEAAARGMAAAGANLALCDVNTDKNGALADSIGKDAHAFYLDVTDVNGMDAAIDEIISHFRKIDVLINCAGINRREGFLDVTEATYDAIMGVNLKGVFFLTQKIVPHMIRNGGGKIINFSSHNAQGMLGGVSVYGATKSAVSALTRSMAIEWAKYNIQANAIAPGHILTELTRATWENPARADYLRERISMGRPGEPGELVGMLIMLASSASDYMTGQTYHVDGGCLAGGKPWDYDTKWK